MLKEYTHKGNPGSSALFDPRIDAVWRRAGWVPVDEEPKKINVNHPDRPPQQLIRIAD